MSPLIRPHLTEKSMLDASRGVYTFMASPAATKSQVKQAVQQLFTVQVLKVTTSLVVQPARRTGRRRLPNLSQPLKLARVWLKPGQSIALFDMKEDN